MIKIYKSSFIYYYNISQILYFRMKVLHFDDKIISMIDDSLGCGEVDLNFIRSFVFNFEKIHRELLELTVTHNVRKDNGGIL